MHRALQQDDKGRRYYQLDEDLKENAMVYLPGPVCCVTAFSVDMTEADSFRKKLENETGVHVSVTSLIVKAAADPLEDFPILCGKWKSMDTLICPNLGEMSVDGPVQIGNTIGFFFINRASQKTLLEISKELEAQVDEIKSAKKAAWPEEGQLTPPACISNVGTLGPVELAFGPVAWFATSILGICAIQEKPVAKDGQIVIRKMMNASLSWDHRAMMANTPIGFLSELKRRLEDPVTYLDVKPS